MLTKRSLKCMRASLDVYGQLWRSFSACSLELPFRSWQTCLQRLQCPSKLQHSADPGLSISQCSLAHGLCMKAGSACRLLVSSSCKAHNQVKPAVLSL